MPNVESSPTSAGAKLQEIITDHAQCYVYGNESIENIHASMRDYANEYRGNSESAKDQTFETIQRMRIEREVILAAVGRIVSDEIIKQVLSYSTEDGLDITRMTKTIKPTYCDGMIHFLNETVDEALCAMARPHQIASFLITHGIAIQDQYNGELPDADTIVEATKETRSHWLAMASSCRIHISNIYYGDTL